MANKLCDLWQARQAVAGAAGHTLVAIVRVNI
jgi:hypothetical protein